MNPHDGPDSLAALWRRQLEMALEAGETPVLSVGLDTLHPDSIPSLAALRQLAANRPAAVTPWVVAGGEGDLWLLAATQWQGNRRGALLYGGNDDATFAATLSLAESPRADGSLLPLGMAWLLTPTAAPGTERSDFEYLPFALAGGEFAPLPTPTLPLDWVARLEGWAVALLALALLTASLIR